MLEFIIKYVIVFIFLICVSMATLFVTCWWSLVPYRRKNGLGIFTGRPKKRKVLEVHLRLLEMNDQQPPPWRRG